MALEELLLARVFQLLGAVHQFQELVNVGVVQTLALNQVGKHLDFLPQFPSVDLYEGEPLRLLLVLQFRNQETAFLVMGKPVFKGVFDQSIGGVFLLGRIVIGDSSNLVVEVVRESEVGVSLVSVPLLLQEIDQEKILQKSLEGRVALSLTLPLDQPHPNGILAVELLHFLDT